MLRVVGLGILMTFVLGFSLAAAYYVVGGTLAWQGPFVLARAWPVIYPLMALAAAASCALVALAIRDKMPLRHFAMAIFIGWLGEYLVLASGILASELNPLSALGFWLIATAGPVQLVAGLLGAGLAYRRRS